MQLHFKFQFIRHQNYNQRQQFVSCSLTFFLNANFNVLLVLAMVEAVWDLLA